MGNEIQRFTAAKRELFDRIYGRLNPEQREAIYTVNGPLLVLAGAGSGKTTVLVNRISHMIKYGDAYYRNGTVKPSDLDIEMLTEAYKFASDEDAEMILSAYAVDPVKAYGILAITFTNKAADEIKNRLAESLNDESISSQIWAGTFHSICVRILRRHLDLLGFQSGSLTIYDTEDTKKLIGDILKSLNIDDKMLPVRTVMTEISRAKDNLVSPDDFSANTGNDYRLSQISKVYIRYQSELQKANAMDFDDLIMRTVMLLKDNRDVLDYYQSKFRYICVDEYQDTNMAQFALIELLSGKYRNIMVVGDDDQSIYKFRGATIKNILEFDTVFSDCKLIKLEQNYRSTQTILNAANSIIKNNFGRKGKNLWTEKQAGEKIVLEELEDQNEESRYIVDTISEYVKSGTKTYKDFAVLYRLNAQANNIESAFARSGMPYRVFGSIRFYDRKEIRDILAYLYLIKNPGDNLHLKRIINTPKRKIGNSTINAVEQLSACENKSMMEIMEKADTYVSIIKSAEKLISFVKMINRFRELSESISLTELIDTVVEETGYREMLEEEGSIGYERQQNIDELSSSAIEYMEKYVSEEEKPLDGFLESISLVSDIDKYDESADAVNLMTIHSAKGLEFPIVFLPGMEEYVFPSSQSQIDDEQMEEERRLAYVAVTRAKEKLYILHSSERLLYGRTQNNELSRFAEEIPKELIQSSIPKRGKRLQENFEFRKTSRESENSFIIDEFEKNKARQNYSINNKTNKAKINSNQTVFKIGDRVKHIKFGSGVILSATQLVGDTIYEIAFDDVGTKKLMASYAKLTRE